MSKLFNFEIIRFMCEKELERTGEKPLLEANDCTGVRILEFIDRKDHQKLEVHLSESKLHGLLKDFPNRGEQFVLRLQSLKAISPSHTSLSQVSESIPETSDVEVHVEEDRTTDDPPNAIVHRAKAVDVLPTAMKALLRKPSSGSFVDVDIQIEEIAPDAPSESGESTTEFDDMPLDMRPVSPPTFGPFVDESLSILIDRLLYVSLHALLYCMDSFDAFLMSPQFEEIWEKINDWIVTTKLKLQSEIDESSG